jgi:hypothetical protein
VTVTYDKPNRELTLAATVTPELVPKPTNLGRPRDLSGNSSIAARAKGRRSAVEYPGRLSSQGGSTMELRPVAPGGVDPALAQARAERARVRAPEDFGGVLEAQGADYPPPEVWREVDRAAQVVQWLEAQDRVLHFGHDEANGRLVIEVRDREGNTLRRIPPSEALAIAGGASA